MGARSNAAPVIIKRKKVVSGDGHHGGAWKVAYADFVTAMMAFFMLMWLLNATTEKQRKGIADYFSPSIPVNRISGGGDGAFGGESVFSEETIAQNGTGASMRHPTEERQARGQTGVADEGGTEQPGQEELRTIEDKLMGRGGESMASENAMRHVVTRVTDEGLIVEFFDLDDAPLFDEGTDMPTPVTGELAAMLAEVFDLVSNGVAVGGHTRAYPVVLIDNPSWELSAARAQRMREMIAAAGLDEARIQRVAGFADRKPAVGLPTAARNNRLEVILLRSDP